MKIFYRMELYYKDEEIVLSFFFLPWLIWNCLIKGRKRKKNYADVASWNFEIEATNETKAWLVVGLASSSQVDKSSTSRESQRLAWVHEGYTYPVYGSYGRHDIGNAAPNVVTSSGHRTWHQWKTDQADRYLIQNYRCCNVTKLFVTPVISSNNRDIYIPLVASLKKKQQNRIDTSYKIILPVVPVVSADWIQYFKSILWRVLWEDYLYKHKDVKTVVETWKDI